MPDACPPVHEISDFLLGIADETSEKFLVAHLRQCPDCQKTACTAENHSDTLLSILKKRAARDLYADEPQLMETIRRLQQRGGINESDGINDETLISHQESIPPRQLGPYRLLSLLGEGGMGTVYKAQHVHLEMIVAVKILASRLTGDHQAVARFEREMKAVGSVSHPNIVRATDAGEQNGQHFLAMEFVDGIDLGRAIKRLGSLRISDACEAIRLAAAGIHQAHTAVGDKGIASIRKMKSLRTLRIEGTRITDAAMEDLASLTQLTTLRIGSRLSEKAVSELRTRLPDCNIELED